MPRNNPQQRLSSLQRALIFAGTVAGVALRPLHELGAVTHDVHRRLVPFVGNIFILLFWLACIGFVFLRAWVEPAASDIDSALAAPLADHLRGGAALCVSLSLLAGTSFAVPRSSIASDVGRLYRLGNWHYGIAGSTGTFLTLIPTIAPTPMGLLAVVMGLATMANAVMVNYCIRKWPTAAPARKDIQKLLIRVPAIMAAASIALMVGAGSFIGSTPVALTLLLLPLTGEVMFVIHKS